MIPDQFANYFLASAGAGAALIGLLFVAISIRPEHTFGVGAHPVRRGVASGAFTALTNAFFISMFALIPQTNVGLIALFVGMIDAVFTVRLARGLLHRPGGQRAETATWGAWWRLAVTLILSVVLYVYEAMLGETLLRQPHNNGAIVGICYVMVWVYAVGLARAWELLGGPGGGMSTWLNPLRTLEEAPSPPAAAPGEEAPAAPVSPSAATAPTGAAPAATPATATRPDRPS